MSRVRTLMLQNVLNKNKCLKTQKIELVIILFYFFVLGFACFCIENDSKFILNLDAFYIIFVIL